MDGGTAGGWLLQVWLWLVIIDKEQMVASSAPVERMGFKPEVPVERTGS